MNRKSNLPKVLIILSVLVGISLASCSQDVANGVGSVQFSVGGSRSIIASIDYPSIYEKEWTITATKTDEGETVGQGVKEGVLLTDSLGSFSTGSWHFELNCYDGETLIYEGEVDTVVSVGNNIISVEVQTVGETGVLSLKDCNIQIEEGKTLNTLYVMVDGYSKGSYQISQLEEIDGLYYLPDLSWELAEGEHLLSVTYKCNETTSKTTAQSIKLRVVPRCTTNLSFGCFRGQASVEVTIQEVEPIIE